MILRKRVPILYLLDNVKREFIFICIYAFGIVYVDEILGIRDINIPIEIPTILGTMISLILAFRTAQAYDRWWEGRILWGAIVNDSRTLARQALNFPRTTSDEVRKIQDRICQLQITWCHVFGDALRKLDLSQSRGSENLDADILSHDNVPNAILREQSRLLTDLRNLDAINEFEYVQMDSTLQRLTDSMGGAERINNTVFPRNYGIYVDVFLYVFIILLPFGIVNYFGIFEGPFIVIIGMSFLILERNAEILQDPFQNHPSDVPVTNIATNIERNIRQMMDEKLPPSQEDNKYYIL